MINAGKSALNEDQACCEVVLVKKKPIGSLTPEKLPTNRRRSSLPSSNCMGMLENNVSPCSQYQGKKRMLIFVINIWVVDVTWHFH